RAGWPERAGRDQADAGHAQTGRAGHGVRRDAGAVRAVLRQRRRPGRHPGLHPEAPAGLGAEGLTGADTPGRSGRLWCAGLAPRPVASQPTTASRTSATSATVMRLPELTGSAYEPAESAPRPAVAVASV